MSKLFKSKFGCEKFTEVADYPKLLYISQHLDDFTFSNKASNEHGVVEQDQWNPKHIIDAILNRMTTDGKFVVSYTKSQNAPTYNKEKVGRWFAIDSASCQCLPREIRHTVCVGHMIDIDIINCHPNILCGLCEKYGIPHSHLREYVENRDKYIKKIIKHNPSYDRDFVKCKVFLKMINGGKPPKDMVKTKWFGNWTTEINHIIKTLSEHPDWKSIHKNRQKIEDAKPEKERYGNVAGATLNCIMCHVENMVLECMVSKFKSDGIISDNIVALVFDGLQVIDSAQNRQRLTQKYFDSVSEYAFEQTGYNLKLKIKPFDEPLALPENYKELITYPEIQMLSYSDKKIEWERSHFKVMHPPMYISLLDESIEQQLAKDLFESYRHEECKGEDGKDVKFVSKWVQDRSIRKFTKIDFLPPPLQCKSDVFNLWRGFPIEQVPLPEGFDIETDTYVKKFKDFMLGILGNQANADYTTAYFANKVQNPSIKNMVCLILYSHTEGTGKDTLFETIQGVIGSDFWFGTDQPETDLYGNHAMGEMRRLVVCVNEASGQANYSNADKLKNRITNKLSTVNPKGIQGYAISNFCDYVMTTNNFACVKIGDTDRRFWVVEAQEKFLKNHAFFDDYYKTVVENPVALRCIFEFLRTFDIARVVPRSFQLDRPQTDIYDEMKSYNSSREMEFMKFYTRVHLSPGSALSKRIENVKYSDLWKWYQTWCKDNNYKMDNITSRKFHAIFKREVANPINRAVGDPDCISIFGANNKAHHSCNDSVYKVDKVGIYEYFFADEDFRSDDEGGRKDEVGVDGGEIENDMADRESDDCEKRTLLLSGDWRSDNEDCEKKTFVLSDDCNSENED